MCNQINTLKFRFEAVTIDEPLIKPLNVVGNFSNTNLVKHDPPIDIDSPYHKN
jgi:hypothetical protein